MVKKIQLKNGLTVLFYPSHKAPVVSVQAWVRTGSYDESRGEEGISHFIEHLVFKGTEKYKVGEIAALIEGAGGELNAYTSFDQTVFYVTISSVYSELAMDAISQMMGHPKFDSTEIGNEREVVIEEIKRGNDSLGRKASQLLFGEAFKNEPYGRPVIGFEKNVRKWSSDKIKSYYSSRYSPANMFLVVSGDINVKEAKSLVDKYFADIPKTKIKPTAKLSIKKQKKLNLKVETSQFEQNLAYFAFKIPDIKHKDIPALEVLSVILGQGDSSRLVERLRIEKPLVNSIGSSCFVTEKAGLFVFSFSYNHENLSEVLSRLSEEIVKAKTTAPKTDEIKRAIINLESEQYYGLETVDGLSRKIGEAEFTFKDPKAQDRMQRKLKEVKASDLIRVANTYFHVAGLTITATTSGSKLETQKLLRKAAGLIKKTPGKKLKIKSAPIKTKLKLVKLKSSPSTLQIEEVFPGGPQAIFYPSGSTAVVSVRAAFLGGARAESEKTAGLTELFCKSWLGGTKKKSEMEIYNAIEAIASGLGPIAGRNSIGMAGDCLKGFEKDLSELFLDVIANASLQQEIIEREKVIQLEQIRTKLDNPSKVCGRQFMAAIFPNHSYGRDQLGDVESLQGLGPEEIGRYYKRLVNRNNITFSVAGNIDKGLWKDCFLSLCEALPEGKTFAEEVSFYPPTKETFLFTQTEKEQSHLIIGFPGLSLDHPDRHTLHIIQSILAGQGGRLFLELRDKHSLAYSVSPMRFEGIGAGYFAAYIGCSPDKVEKATSMINTEFSKLKEELVSEKEIDRAKKYLIGRHDIDLQRTSAIASSVLYEAIYGLDPEKETFNIKELYASIDAVRIQKVARDIFTQKPIVSLVGPHNPFADRTKG